MIQMCRGGVSPPGSKQINRIKTTYALLRPHKADQADTRCLRQKKGLYPDFNDPLTLHFLYETKCNVTAQGYKEGEKGIGKTGSHNFILYCTHPNANSQDY